MNQEAKVLTIIGVVTVAILIGAVFMLSKSGTESAKNASTPVDNNLLIKSDSHKIATDSAKVTIVEFGDYQCPACAAAHPNVKEILKEYSGKVNFVFRHFPLPQHQNAMIGAEAAEAAGEQGKYFQMHDLLYERQRYWSENDKPLEIFTEYAKELNLDTEQFTKAVSTNKNQQRIYADRNDGQSLGINSTPTIYINGKKLPSFDINEFKKSIDEAESQSK